MRKSTMTQTVALVAMLQWGLMLNAGAQEAQGKAQAGDAEAKAQVDLSDDRKENKETTIDRSENKSVGQGRSAGVDDFHKASTLIGMEVKNHQGEPLGEIQDLVVDIKTGRISYAVLQVGGFLGIGEKFIAVPMTAFAPDQYEPKLVLNADREKVRRAPGFVRTNWPDPKDPNWGAKAGWGAETDPIVSQDTAQPSDQTAPGRVGSAEQETFIGSVTAIDPDARTITVKGPLGTKVFEMGAAASSNSKDAKQLRFSDFRVGDQVRVQYKPLSEGRGVAYKVEQTEERDNKK